MMKTFMIMLFFIAGCSIPQTKQNENAKDEFDKILAVMKTKEIESLYQQFGRPDKISTASAVRNTEVISYVANKDHSSLDAYIDNTTRKITHITIFYWKDFDNYSALKKRFADYKWIETKLEDNKKSDALTDTYLVQVPEAHMEFQYDSYAPMRKVMWVYFD